MKIMILRAEYSRGHLDSLDHELVEIDQPLWPYARSTASRERRDAAPFLREFYSPARKSGNGAYGWSAGEESAVYLIPEGHPNFGLDYANLQDWSDEDIERWTENLGDCH